MKCLVLAGGSSDRLWPLSRKDYPKQFMEIRESRSMFQEAVLRNMPFCTEFVILTNKRYENVVRGQMQVFQGIEYSFVYEEVALKTALAVVLYALRCDPEEELLIVSTDCIIEGDYKAVLTQLKDEIKDGKFAAVVSQTAGGTAECNYVNRDGKMYVFGGKKSKNSLFDCGIMGAKAQVLLDAIDKNILKKYKAVLTETDTVKAADVNNVPLKSLGKIICTENCSLVYAKFTWTRITDISSFYNFYNKAIRNNRNTIVNNSKDVEIINAVDGQLIVANGLKNIAIVNTRDAIFVTNGSKEADVKDITSKYYLNKKKYFDNQPKKYEIWGMEELIGSADDCKVKLLTIYQRENYRIKNRRNIITNLFFVQGEARLEGGSSEVDYAQDGCVTIGDTDDYRLYNTGKSNLIVVCTEKTVKSGRAKTKKDYLIKMLPVFKDNLWGGTKIRDVFGKDVDNMDIIAESWELSAHKDGESRVAFGEYAGRTLNEYIASIGKDRLGWKAQAFDRFPIMIKFIDARQNLSIQVHPEDDYAMSMEDDFGKNEMWHILDADEDACVYIGFNKDVTDEEIRERIANNTLMQVINKVPVKKNETYFLKAGVVHAIGAGCLICEVQQSSNVTYRLYDYGRRDKDGNLRELHIDKALAVLDKNKYSPKTYEKYDGVMRSDFVKTLIGQCKYFTVNKYFIDGECVLPRIESSFQAFVVLDGYGAILDSCNEYEIRKGDTWFAASMEQITICGKCSLLAVNI